MWSGQESTPGTQTPAEKAETCAIYQSDRERYVELYSTVAVPGTGPATVRTFHKVERDFAEDANDAPPMPDVDVTQVAPPRGSRTVLQARAEGAQGDRIRGR